MTLELRLKSPHPWIPFKLHERRRSAPSGGLMPLAAFGTDSFYLLIAIIRSIGCIDVEALF
jgi:hypothetical protein